MLWLSWGFDNIESSCNVCISYSHIAPTCTCVCLYCHHGWSIHGNSLDGVLVCIRGQTEVLGSCVCWLELFVNMNNTSPVFLADDDYEKNQSPDKFVTVFINPLLLEIFKVKPVFHFHQLILTSG